jgi:uncharacterized protein
MNIRHEEAHSRFESDHEEPAVLAYDKKEDGTLDLHHTAVPPSLEGKGVGGQLVRYAIDHARAQGIKIIPTCGFVRSWLDRHPDQADIVAS